MLSSPPKQRQSYLGMDQNFGEKNVHWLCDFMLYNSTKNQTIAVWGIVWF